MFRPILASVMPPTIWEAGLILTRRGLCYADPGCPRLLPAASRGRFAGPKPALPGLCPADKFGVAADTPCPVCPEVALLFS